MSRIRRLAKDDLPRLRNFWIEQWGSEVIVAHNEVIRYDEVEGFIYDDWAGVITFMIRDTECEITSLDSLHEGKGIGTALINQVVEEAKEKKCRRVFLITTNDNLHALGFYQRYGFELVTIRRGAINESRKIKPTIPLIGMNNIPLRDEIELEILI
ncbi:MAG: GNAT family N-acetyltransferase [Anaerolineales bacterium]|nr:GNAT family N-acetyltransferase [Anaerolineales bacterium]